MTRFKKPLLAFLVTFCTFGMLSEHVRVLRSLTPSLPYRYFLHFPKISPSKGQLTTFFHAPSQKLLIKQILGVESDVVASTGEALYLNGMNVGKVFKNDTHGQKLTPLKSQVIPRGNVFLYAPHPRSFDSRYAEVGLVPLPKLQGRVVGIV